MEKHNTEMTVDATLDNLNNVVGFVEDSLGITSCPMKLIMQLELCVEELFVNVASYAYGEKTGSCKISIDSQHTDDTETVIIKMEDFGKQFNPLEKEDPDITLSADERQIGGLGIYMVKQTMDKLEYSYEENKNILRLEKSWHV